MNLRTIIATQHKNLWHISNGKCLLWLFSGLAVWQVIVGGEITTNLLGLITILLGYNLGKKHKALKEEDK